MAIATPRGGPPGGMKAVKVCLIILHFDRSDTWAASPQRSAFMVETRSPQRFTVPGHHDRIRSNSVNCDSMDGKGKCTRLRSKSGH